MEMIGQTTAFTSNHTPIWFQGSGHPVIFVHGLLMDHRMWIPQVSALSKICQTCCIDLLGHGQAPDLPGERTIDDFIEQIHEVVEVVGKKTPPILVGFSMGAMLAQIYAMANHNRLCGLVLMNAVYNRTPTEIKRVKERFRRNQQLGVESAKESALRRWFRDEDWHDHHETIETISGWIQEGNFAAKRKAQRVFITTQPELVGNLATITCPTLVMTGERDSGSTPRMAASIADIISGAKLSILPDQHHMMSLIAPQQVNAILGEFIENLVSEK